MAVVVLTPALLKYALPLLVFQAPTQLFDGGRSGKYQFDYVEVKNTHRGCIVCRERLEEARKTDKLNLW